MAATVLLLEDEEAVRSLVRLVLEAAGFTVLEARDADEALELCESQQALDILLTDVEMPDTTGPQVAGMVASRSPDTRVLYMSGYTDQAVLRHGVSAGRNAFLQKPFTPAELTDKLRAVLAAPLDEAQP